MEPLLYAACSLPNPNLMPASCMWNPKAQPQAADDDSWEVRAFAEDIGNVLGTTWPPRSYTCSFCAREFRSAQALGGHMDVHRRDRARLHQTYPATDALRDPATSSILSATAISSSTLLIPTQHFPQNAGFCLLHHHDGVPASQPMNACSIDSPSTLVSISPYPPPVMPPRFSNSSSLYYSNLNGGSNAGGINFRETSIGELDLELRLGHPPPTS
ncbi:hypothetical protein V6Z12_A12G239100, partial [Gossypium hirsutum]|uniref:Transcriptional regulator SUPERMAN n=1 Tax=Gossypium hirsutum TaxID=3635 RepID=A0A1U8NIL7_GOSHI|nr:transcriptional regulator SUPERMAN-like [Gossypium hirsutum]